ncbi:DUF134 domain-containing protein [Candidatus Parcubacteria bacterium]|nr:MAG: DUF134 domain-containing protein [Candidatus Parcubacteria bacterium]
MSPRPRAWRRIRFRPEATMFKPIGIPARALETVILSLEEMEAIRLTQYQELTQQEAALQMQTSQSTVQRLLSQANKKIAKALIEGKAIIIQKEGR